MAEISEKGSVVGVKTGANSLMLRFPLQYSGMRQLIQILLLLEINPKIRCYYVLDEEKKSQKLQGRLLRDFPTRFTKWQYDSSNQTLRLLKATEEN